MKKLNANKENYKFFLLDSLIPKGFIYPASYSNFVKEVLPNLDPWDFFYDNEELEFCFEGLRKRYPTRILVPFSRRIDSDDFACFNGEDSSGNPSVVIIHDWASPGWENRGKFKDFLEWLEFAKKQSEEWKMSGGQ